MKMISEQERDAMKVELCRVLNKIGALRFGAFKLTSGRVSPYYIDLRIVPSFPEAFQRVCKIYANLIEGDVGAQGFDRIAGIPTASIPFSSFLAYHFKKPFFYIRPEARLHGRGCHIEGIMMPGDHVLVIDDLITTGGSVRKAVAAIRAEGGLVTDATVLIDREEGGKEKLAEDNVKLHYLLKASEGAEKLYEVGVITKDQLETIMKQVEKE
jgi:orotate phosphoribosyltransferase